MKGDLLQYSSKEYLATINRGLSLVLNGILLVIIIGVAGMIAGVALPSLAGTVLPALNLANVAVSFLILFGYFQFSELDPAYSSQDTQRTSRSVLRIAVIAMIVVQTVSFAISMLPNSALGTATFLVGLLLSMASLAAWLTQFIAVMTYTAWLAGRVPDETIRTRALRYRWLLPVITVVGAVVLIGPLIALVLYWNLLDRMRKHTRSLLAKGQPANLPGLRPN